ncbi:MAG: sugar-binding domain-containing protein [Acidimicrobiales bacterium]
MDVTDEVIEPLRSLELAFIARRYYLEGRTKVQIADELSISRFRVARLLDDAREAGIVKIEIATPSLIDTDLSFELERRFGLDRAVVATVNELSVDSVRLAVARLAAALLPEVLTDADVVGIGWGRTLHDLISHLPPLPPCTTVQIVGGMPEVELWMNSVDLVRRFAERTGGPMHTFLLPYLVNDGAVAKGLQADPSFVRARGWFSELSLVIAAIGSWDPPQSGLFDLLADAERDEIRSAGVVADIFGTLIDESGSVVASPVASRSTGIDPEQLRAVPSVIGVAAGAAKTQAVGAALESGLLSALVTDAGVARALLDL